MMETSARNIWLAVALGSAAGSVARFSLTAVALTLPGSAWPWATLLANVCGSLLIGLYARLTEPDGRIYASPATRHFVLTGFCGGFTTFSIFSLEAVMLIDTGATGLAATYVAISLLMWLPSAWIGDRIGERINRLHGE